MLNYVGFLNEARDHRNKIKKFANVDQIYDWAHKFDSDMSLWIADKVVKVLKNRIKDKDKLKILDTYLKTGKTKNPDDVKPIRSMIGKVKSALVPKFRKVLDYVNSPLHLNKPNINKLSLEEALQKSELWHEEIKNNADGFVIEEEDGEIIMTFPDGYYWIDLQSTSCSDEGSAMGHCANTSKGSTLLSLRRYKQPHVTISWEESDNVFYQIKGKGNDKPVEKYHPYIVDLICHLGVEGKRAEYSADDDFSPDDLDSELYDKLNNCNPQYINNKEMSEEELEERYRDDLANGQLEEEIEMGYFSPSTLFWHVDDSAFLENLVDDETDYYCYQEFEYYKGQEEDLIEWIMSHVSEESIFNLEEDLEQIKEDWGYDEDEEYEEEDLEELEELLEERRNKSYQELLEDKDFDELEEIMDNHDIKEGFVRNDQEDRYSSAEDYYNSLYGNSDNITGKEFMEIFGNYFDEDGLIDQLVQDADYDDLRERYE